MREAYHDFQLLCVLPGMLKVKFKIDSEVVRRVAKAVWWSAGRERGTSILIKKWHQMFICHYHRVR